jgi:membrane protein
VNNLANYSRFYGTLGAVVALMLWLLVVSMIMLFSAQINALLIEVRGIRDPYIHVVQNVKDRVAARRNGKTAASESIVEKE